MTVKFFKYSVFFHIVLCFVCCHTIQLSAQTIDNLYLGRWFGYTAGTSAKPDSNYTRVDSFIEMTFRKDGTYNIKGYTKTDIYTPGKGHLRFKKNFRYMDGRYEINENQLELKTGFNANEAGLYTHFEFESSTNRFKQIIPYFKLWNANSFYEYTPVENFKNADDFFSQKRKAHNLFIVSMPSHTIDSIAFWSTSPDCPDMYHWPKPALLTANVPLKKSMLDSISNLVEDLEKMYVYNSADQLIRFYYTAKKEKSFYYDITYFDSMSETPMIKTITDSKDLSHYVFFRNEKGCLEQIERYDGSNQLLETFYWR